MGYYTSYNLNTYGSDEDKEKFEKKLLEISDEDSDVRELLTYGGVNAKLYDLEAWIQEIVRDIPNLLVVLSGDGDDSDDQWEMRWKGEAFEEHRAVMPPFQNPELFIFFEKEQLNK